MALVALSTIAAEMVGVALKDRLTRAQDLVSLPNDLVIQSGVTNFSGPTTTHFCSVYGDAAYRIPPKQICAVLLGAAAAVPRVLQNPNATALVTAFNESAIQYRIKFAIDDFAQRDVIESLMRTYIWHAFARMGIDPFPQRVGHRTIEPERSRTYSEFFLGCSQDKMIKSRDAQGCLKPSFIPR